MKKNFAWISLILVLALAAGLLSGCGASKKIPEYTVTFDLNGGELVSGSLTQTVEEGKDAVLPEAVNGRMELSWDDGWKSVNSDRTVTAQWTKVPMNTVDLAEYLEDRTVTVNVKTLNGGESAGSGFFISSDGVIVTNFHVIDMASSISVEIGSGANYTVRQVIDFSNIYDLAILKIDVTDHPYLEIAEDPVRKGEQVYAMGSALGTLTGTFTSGIVSSTSRTYGQIECIQIDAAINPGNSGGPLVNTYGEVVGINVAKYVDGEGLNLAIKTSTLEQLSQDKNWTVNEFKEWYETESSRSWSPWYVDNGGTQHWTYSLVKTYQEVTGATCNYSCFEYVNDKGENDVDIQEGYIYDNDFFVYDYSSADYDSYVAYLKSVGFEYDESENFSNGISYYYQNDKDSILVDLFILNDFSEIWIYPHYL